MTARGNNLIDGMTYERSSGQDWNWEVEMLLDQNCWKKERKIEHFPRIETKKSPRIDKHQEPFHVSCLWLWGLNYKQQPWREWRVKRVNVAPFPITSVVCLQLQIKKNKSSPLWGLRFSRISYSLCVKPWLAGGWLQSAPDHNHSHRPFSR